MTDHHSKKIKFSCDMCGIQSEKGRSGFYQQKKRIGKVLCAKCSKINASSMTSDRLINKYSASLKNTDIVELKCKCGNTSNVQYRAFKRLAGRDYVCTACTNKNNHIEYRESYERAAALRKGNPEFSKLISEGLLKSSKEDRSIRGKEAAYGLWNNQEKRKRELDRRNTSEYRTKMSGKKTNLITNIEYLARAQEIHDGKYDYSLVDYTHSKNHINIICKKHGLFTQIAADHLYHRNGCPKCAMQIEISKPHQGLIDLVKTYDPEIVINDRDVFNGLEIDIYSAKAKFGIEIHGLYWHSYNRKETTKEVNRHMTKADKACDNNIILFQIFENELRDKAHIIKSMIKHKFSDSTRVNARDCSFKFISASDAKAFFNANHLQGHRNARHYFGLLYNGTLISAISISSHSTYENELIRYATLLDFCVVGGFGKLLRNAAKVLNLKTIMTYADRRYSAAGVYMRENFKTLKITKPGYSYVKSSKLYSRQKFQKHNLPDILEEYNESLSEAENMFNNGYRRLWDAGHIKLIKVF